MRIAEALCAGKGKAPKTKPLTTVRQLGEIWTDGRLARDYPDQIKKERTADDDESRLKKHVYPVIGDRPVVDVTLDDAEAVMRRSTRSSRRLPGGTSGRRSSGS